MTMFQVENVSKRFGDTAVLNNINIAAPEGSFITILGPSGCGKTTLLRIIAGLETADQGRVVNGDLDFVDTDRHILREARDRQLGFVFQDFALWPHMTVLQNVAFPLQMQGVAAAEVEQRCRQILDDVRLGDHLDKRPEQLSGGQKQRVSIARALVAKPRIVLFDEPLSALDANLRVELGQEIRLLSKKHGVTCINVTHDRREAQVLSDKIALMKDGVIHQFADPETVFRQPVDVWAAQFLDSGNILPADALGDVVTGDYRHYLVPRQCLNLAEGPEFVPLQVAILDCIYLEERYEILATLAGYKIRFYSDRRADIGSTETVWLDQSGLRGLDD